jgi:hypothetical protein
MRIIFSWLGMGLSTYFALSPHEDDHLRSIFIAAGTLAVVVIWNLHRLSRQS